MICSFTSILHPCPPPTGIIMLAIFFLFETQGSQKEDHNGLICKYIPVCVSTRTNSLVINFALNLTIAWQT